MWGMPLPHVGDAPTALSGNPPPLGYENPSLQPENPFSIGAREPLIGMREPLFAVAKEPVLRSIPATTQQFSWAVDGPVLFRSQPPAPAIRHSFR